MATLPPLKEKTVSTHSISSYHKLARIQETKSTSKEVGVVEPPSGSQSQPCDTLTFLPLIFSSAPHPSILLVFYKGNFRN